MREQQVQKVEDIEKQLKHISERIEKTMVAQKHEEIKAPSKSTKKIDGIMKREALASAKSLAQALSKGRPNDWC
jgi:hypothetical protein